MRFALLLVLLIAIPARTQTPGTCERGLAFGELEAEGSEVFARVFNTGALFFNNYAVPRANANYPVYSTALWIGGRVNGSIRVSGAQFSRFEMWPGPLRAGAAIPNRADCTAYDRIFVVSRTDIARYLDVGEASDDLLDWPIAWGAPVLDGDGIMGNYDLEGGDQPAISGEQMAWWVMNDVGNVHEATLSDPLGVEVQVSAIAAGAGIRALAQASYYRYTIVNRSDVPIDSAYVSLFSQAKLRWVGTDTTLSMGFVYNGDTNQDERYIPPALGFQVVQGPVGLPNGRDDDGDGAVDEAGEQLGLTRMTHWCGSCSPPGTNDPLFAAGYYNQMRGRWSDGTPFTEAGFGYETDGPETLFVFAGDPVTNQCWSHGNDCLGGMVYPWRGNIVVHTGPFYLEPGESTEVVFALPFAQGANHLDSITQLRNAAYVVNAAWDMGVLAPERVEAASLETFDLQVSSPFPNPFTGQTTIRYELPEAMAARLAVYDVLGREVAVLVDAEQPAGRHEVVFDGAVLAPGIYVVRFEAAGEERTFSVVKLR